MFTNISRIESLLADPAADTSLNDLKTELNELAKLRNTSRLAFCKRLAVAYMLLVGHKYGPGAPRGADTKKFYEWAWKNLRSFNDKQYSTGTLKSYLAVGFASNPEKILAQRNENTTKRSTTVNVIGNRIMKAVREDIAPKVVPISRLKQKYSLPTNVAQEVNALMRAWEEASPQARSQFIYLVTGKRVSA